MRVCIVYDHVFPLTVGGAERWLRDLSVRLAAAGHEVTYLTMRHWRDGEEPELPGVRVIAATRRWRAYREDRRVLAQPVLFGVGVLRHLLRHGREYDVVHVGSFPFFGILAAGGARRRGRYRIVVDWYEVWTRRYWQSYAGRAVGLAGWLLQRLCLHVPQRAFCLSQLHARRLRAEGFRSEVTVLQGLYAGPVDPSPSAAVEPLVVYAGRHVPEKRIPALVRAFALARGRRPELRLEVYGDGPERPRLEALVGELGLGDAAVILGRRPEQEVAAAFARAACVATASEREGYGLIVVEAAARGTPSIVVAGPENAAVELVADGVNGAVAASADPEELAAAVRRVVEAGAELRASTVRWFAENAERLCIDGSLEAVLASYER
jgi:glycosyltransferase involved in cell wall biosynthesis